MSSRRKFPDPALVNGRSGALHSAIPSGMMHEGGGGNPTESFPNSGEMTRNLARSAPAGDLLELAPGFATRDSVRLGARTPAAPQASERAGAYLDWKKEGRLVDAWSRRPHYQKT